MLSQQNTHQKKTKSSTVRSQGEKVSSMRSFHGKRVSVLGRIAGVAAMLAACFVLSGCGNGLAQVSGQVTLDGQPLRGGSGDVRVTVHFLPASGVGPTAIGLADENGNYILGTGSQTGVPPGDYVVTCAASALVRPAGGSAAPSGRRIIDPKYANATTSGLQFTVQPGNNEFDISLQSPAKTSSRSGA